LTAVFGLKAKNRRGGCLQPSDNRKKSFGDQKFIAKALHRLERSENFFGNTRASIWGKMCVARNATTGKQREQKFAPSSQFRNRIQNSSFANRNLVRGIIIPGILFPGILLPWNIDSGN
jgi:hypothetical protein